MRLLLTVLVLSVSALAQLHMQESHTKESLRGLSIVSKNEVWASGTHGTYLFTTDDGITWQAKQVPGAEALDFRGIEAFGEEVFLLAAGPGDSSRIYHSADRGKHWELQFTNPQPKGFFDCMVFADEKHGTVVGDPVNGKFQILQTEDGGKNWHLADAKNMPLAIEGEGAFAASNSCIAVIDKNIWFVTGGTEARVFHSGDGGSTWTVVETPIVHGSASQGIFSVMFRDEKHGIIAGGDYKNPDQGGANLATTDDGGKTWKPAEINPQRFFSAVAYMTDTNHGAIVVGSGVAACSLDALYTWNYESANGFNAVESRQGVTYAVGANGKIARFQILTTLR